jgi:predicted permease
MDDVLAGASIVAAAAIALFFLRFWRDTGDRFFALFALAFAIFAANRLFLTLLDDESEARTLVYLARALAFGVIVVAIVDKNRPAASGRSP